MLRNTVFKSLWIKPLRLALLAVLVLLACSVSVQADGLVSTAQPWQMGMQPAASILKQKIVNLHDGLIDLIFFIPLLILVLLIVVVVRFRAGRNPVPSKRTHNLPLEIVWTAIPTLILLVIAVPSFRLLYYGGQTPEAAMTVKIVGRQWYWQYVYAAPVEPAKVEAAKAEGAAAEQATAAPDKAEPVEAMLDFESRIIPTEELKPGQLRLLEVDNPLVLPVGQVIRLQFTAADVIHGWMVPALGIHRNTVPGKLTEAWVKIEKPGTFYGQCMQICGVQHGFMPIVVRALPPAEYQQWLVEAKKKFSA
jgi:cytochrome c oxidase subunit 2